MSQASKTFSWDLNSDSLTPESEHLTIKLNGLLPTAHYNSSGVSQYLKKKKSFHVKIPLNSNSDKLCRQDFESEIFKLPR